MLKVFDLQYFAGAYWMDLELCCGRMYMDILESCKICGHVWGQKVFHLQISRGAGTMQQIVKPAHAEL